MLKASVITNPKPMRTLFEIVLAAALIALAWEKSLEERARDIPWLGDKIAVSEKSTKTTKAPQSPPVSTPAAWMSDPNRRSVLDTPPPKSTTLHPEPTSTAGSWLFDPKHRSPLDPPTKKRP
jgi:hypothetical protein